LKKTQRLLVQEQQFLQILGFIPTFNIWLHTDVSLTPFLLIEYPQYSISLHQKELLFELPFSPAFSKSGEQVL
jgi:hypothetical protein